MKIVVDALIFQKDPHGGIARLFREILPRMCDLDPDLRVSMFCDGPLKAEPPIHPQIEMLRTPPVHLTVRVKGVWRQALYPFRRIASRIWGRMRGLWLRSERGAIWHSTFYTTPGAWEGPQVVTVYDMVPEHFPEYFHDPLDAVARHQKRHCLEQAKAIICLSEATRQDLLHWYGDLPGRIEVIHLACNPLFKPLDAPAETGGPGGPGDQDLGPAAVPGDPPASNFSYILYVGSRAEYKNFSGLLNTYAAWDRRAQVRLIVVGLAWTEAERERLAQMDVAGRVSLLSGVDDLVLRDLYQRAATFVYPSLYEGFGIPLLEALACGCPVVASRIPSSLEIAGDCPFYFDPADPGSLLQALDQALEHGRDPERLRLGLERAASFSWDRTARQTLEIYHSLQTAG